MRCLSCCVYVLFIFGCSDSTVEPTPNGIECSAPHVFCAHSLSHIDVQAAVDSALASAEPDVIVLMPAGTATWTSGTKLAISTGRLKKLRLLGSGISSTIITNFQINLPANGVCNLVEVAHFTAYGAPPESWSSYAFMDYRLRPFDPGNELHWHDLVIDRYGANYTLHFEGWTGVVSNINMTCMDRSGQNPYGITVHGNGGYRDNRDKMGGRDAFFIEESTFNYCSHTVSLFCNAYVVFRNNTVNNADSYLDIHGPGYNFCYFGLPNEDKHGGGGFEIYDNHFHNYQGSWHVSPRAGSAGIITGNKFHSGGSYAVCLQAQETCTHSVNCGEGEGKTYDRIYISKEGDGCLQMLENWFIWDNECHGSIRCNPYIYVKTECDLPLRENIDYFLRAPREGDPVESWSRFTYPHPLRN